MVGCDFAQNHGGLSLAWVLSYKVSCKVLGFSRVTYEEKGVFDWKNVMVYG